jgi:glycine hydroxymethyltransferase
VLLIDVTGTPLADGRAVEERLERANIIINRNLLPWDIREGRHFERPGGIRLGTSEITRLGMRKGEMVEIAEFIRRLVMDGEDPKKVGADVAEFRRQFQKVHYCFEQATEAYKYIKVR